MYLPADNEYDDLKCIMQAVSLEHNNGENTGQIFLQVPILNSSSQEYSFSEFSW